MFSFIGLKPVNTELIMKEKTKITGMNINGKTTVQDMHRLCINIHVYVWDSAYYGCV